MIVHRMFKIVLVLVLKGALSAAEPPQLIASFAVCPDTEPAQDSACSPLLANVTCDYGQFCCEGDGKCVPENSCYCDGSTFYCFASDATLTCPSVCPEEPPLMNEACDIDYRYQCFYGDAVVCDDPDYSSDFEHQCGCYNGQFYCYSSTCPLPCPATPPVDGDACSAPFINDGCNYGEFCCGDECIPDKTCYCAGTSISCYEGGGSLTCPEVCPTEPPMTNDSCELDDRYLCEYGDAFVCEDSGYSFDYEKQCFCYDGTFHCNSNACPVPCPKTQPIQGADCSPFVDFACTYGEFCCPGGEGECIPEKECYCDESTMKISCHEPIAWCPSACPATKPLDGASCAISERIDCEYATGFCIPGDTEVLDTSCVCVLGTFVCYNYCSSSNEGGVMDDDFMVVGVQPPAQPPAQVPIPKVFVEESTSESPSASPTFSDAQQVNEHHGGKNGGKKKDKKKMMNARKLGGRWNRGAAGGDETFVVN